MPNQFINGVAAIAILAMFIVPCVFSGIQAFPDGAVLEGLYLSTEVVGPCPANATTADRIQFENLRHIVFVFRDNGLFFWPVDAYLQDTSCCKTYGSAKVTTPYISWDQINQAEIAWNDDSDSNTGPFSLARVIFEDGRWFNRKTPALNQCLNVTASLDYIDSKLNVYLSESNRNAVEKMNPLWATEQKLRFSAFIIPAASLLLFNAMLHIDGKREKLLLFAWCIPFILHVAAHITLGVSYTALHKTLKNGAAALGWELQSRYEWINLGFAICIHHILWGVGLLKILGCEPRSCSRSLRRCCRRQHTGAVPLMAAVAAPAAPIPVAAQAPVAPPQTSSTVQPQQSGSTGVIAYPPPDWTSKGYFRGEQPPSINCGGVEDSVQTESSVRLYGTTSFKV